jgi:zinc protease
MRIARILLAVVLCASPAWADSALEGLADPAEGLQVTQLENGLTVLTLENRSTPVASFQVWVKAGSRDETRYTGIAHLFEHMMFKGTRHLGPGDFTRYIEGRGGRLNAYTSRDVTVYFEDVTGETLPLVIDLEAERMAHLDLTQELLDTEREVVLEERRMRTEDNPNGLAFEALLALSFRAHPYRRPVIGWRSDVEEVTVEACRRFYETYYAPNNLVVTVVGDFDSEDVLARIRRAFGPMTPAEVIPRSPTREPEQKGERRDVVHFDVRAPIVTTAWHAPPTGHSDGPALDVLSTILSSGRSSRLYRRLVNDEQAALSASGGYWELHDGGVFYGSVRVRPDADIERAEALFFEEIARVRDEPVREAELEKAKRKIEVGLVSGLRTNHALAQRIGGDWAAFGRVRPLRERLEEIQAVDAAAVQRVAGKYLTPTQRSVVRVVPPPAEEPAS